MSPLLLLLVYCVIISLASMLGGRLSTLVRLTHLRTQLLMSCVGGLMLGIALLHLFPHAAEELRSTSQAGVAALTGLIAMFLLIRLFHTHDHQHSPVDRAEGPADSHSDCDHGTDHQHAHHSQGKGFSWTGLYFGLALHTLVDGVALASSVIADAQHGAWLGLAGLGTFLAVAMHKPLDAFAITMVMKKQFWSSYAQGTANLLFSLICPLGALLFYLGTTQLGNTLILGWGLGISAGFFLGIALADLLPEVAFHTHDRGKLTAALLLGVAVAVGIENLPGHDHSSHSHFQESPHQNDHDHRHHDHRHDRGHHHGDHSH